MTHINTCSKSRKKASTSITSTEQSIGPLKQLNIEKDSKLERFRRQVNQLEAEKKAQVDNNTNRCTSLMKLNTYI